MKEQGHSISEIVTILRNKDAAQIETGQLELFSKHPEKEETHKKAPDVQETLQEKIKGGKQVGEIIGEQHSSEDTQPAFKNSAKFHYFSIVVAKLKDAVRLSSELPTSYYAFFSEYLWGNARKVLKEYHGVWGNSTENRLIFFFIKGDETSSYIYDSFCAAVELKKLMLETENIFSEKKIYSEDMRLNMGIVEGYGFLKDMSAEKPGTIT
ncbi:MAG: hypothetical protein PHI59_08395, partial [Candidatus Omnitrophica bacterium]|nr:hypothetical protein [Candidatus Omnitrophota bacterium]